MKQQDATKPKAVQGDLRNLPQALAPLTKLPNWVCWRFEWRVDRKGVGKWTKAPLRPDDPERHAKSNDPSSWGPYAQALAVYEAGKCDGIGFNLLGTEIAAFDPDKCRDPVTGAIAPEALAIVERAASYTEVTVSGTGLRIIGIGTGDSVHRKQKIPGSPVEVESYRKAERYIVVTGNPLPNTPTQLSDIDAVIDAVVAELDGEPQAEAEGGEELPYDLIKLIDEGPPPEADLSAAFHHAVCWLGDLSWSAQRIELRIVGRPIVPERYGKRLMQEILRCLGKRSGQGVTFDDFYAFMPKHAYIYAPTGEMWPAASVNARLPSQPVKKKDGTPALDAQGKPRYRKANVWLDQRRPVEQLLWAPGEPRAISDRLLVEGGWVERVGVMSFNLYRPPLVRPGKAANAIRWIELVRRVFPDDAEHIIAYCAHCIQYPAIKINHGLLVGGSTGIGKDTIFEPLKLGVGPWNFKEVSPQSIMGNYNDYMRSVVLRISEARDLGEVNRYSFHDHMKPISASPPDTVWINAKYVPQHYVLNVCRVIYTTNHRYDALYLPANDRRTYVAWSESKSEDFADEFWREFWGWYKADGLEDVVAYLAAYDLSKFDPKAPPPKTPAFRQIVGAGAAPEESELADALDLLGSPVVTTLDQVRAVGSLNLGAWLQERKNRRTIPHRFEVCGYVPVTNTAAKDGYWVIDGKRQTVYGRLDAEPNERSKAIKKLTAAKNKPANKRGVQPDTIFKSDKPPQRRR
jgi:hypothetical protein